MATPPDGAAVTVEGAPAAPPSGAGADAAASTPAGTHGFEVHLDVFSGPFDLLLGLIAKHKLDITEIALAKVTDEFIAHIRAAERAAAEGGRDWDLSQASEFLLVAATLLDLKAARLLPSAQVEDAEDLELLEARDLLFARLLQYRAYKVVAGDLGARLEAESRRFGRSVQLEPHLAALLPELVWQMGPERLAALAARALAPKPPPPGVDISHLHAPPVSVREQAAVLVERLRHQGAATFRALTGDADEPVVVVVRFLALLELFREGAVAFDQVTPLGELTVRWTGSADGDVTVSDDFDRAAGEVTEDVPGAQPVTDADVVAIGGEPQAAGEGGR
ncbi:segregation/condensation protein A [Cellulomonas sp. JZ18]|uniref:segregation and condensation protein A n=1 Tax=Cellulomonas sp. JZ18 TaxID=2654191 RepID=UPI0012D38E46|nr:ScpA family protein [Cellulomonas sp. JZ18]QGQ19244.1 segregation/condensation protein A [Cellulomonas sp. JZ18]